MKSQEKHADYPTGNRRRVPASRSRSIGKGSGRSGVSGIPCLPPPSFPFPSSANLLERFRTRNVKFPGRSAKPLARLPVTEMKPWIRDLSDMWQALFGKMPPLKVSFRARALPDTWADFRMDRHSWANSGLAHVLLVMLAVLPAFIHGSEPPQDDTVIYDFTLLSINLPPIPPGEGKIGGGGGGGDRSPTPAPKGGAPKFDINQFTPPQVVLKNLQPILPADPHTARRSENRACRDETRQSRRSVRPGLGGPDAGFRLRRRHRNR